MRSSMISAGLLVSGAVGQPFGHGNQESRAAHNKRALVTTWVVTTETVYEIIDEFTTFLSTPDVATTLKTSASSTPSSFSSETGTSASSSAAAQFFEGATSAAALHMPPPAPKSTFKQVPANTRAPDAQPEKTALRAPPAPPASVHVGLPAVSTTTALAAAGPASKFSGDLTYYDLGLGACGWDDSGKGETENIVAIAVGRMGPKSNGNSWCGKTVTLERNGVTQEAVVRDKCMGCQDDAIDGSPHLFKALFGASLDKGRGTVTWWVNE